MFFFPLDATVQVEIGRRSLLDGRPHWLNCLIEWINSNRKTVINCLFCGTFFIAKPYFMKHFTLAAMAICLGFSAVAQSPVATGSQLLDGVPQMAPALRTAAPMPTMAISDFSDRPQQPMEGQSSTDVEHYMS